MNTVVIKGLSDSMLLRILPHKPTPNDLSYAHINTVLFIPTEKRKTIVVFDARNEWNYTADMSVEELFSTMSAIKKAEE